MDINTYTAISQTTVTTTTKKTDEKADKANATTASETPKSGFSDVAATYEAAEKPAGDNAVNKANDRTALIQMLKDDQEKLKNNLFSIVQKSLTGQAGAFSIANNDSDMWKIIASGKFTASAEDIAKAKEDIAEDGYWGVDKTSSRIVDFAIALSGNDTSKADKLLDAFEKGFKQATGTWGQKLPDISRQTHDAVVEKFNKWKEGTYTPQEDSLKDLMTNPAQ